MAPVLDPIGNKTVDELVELTFTASATDEDLPANTVTFSLVGAPVGATHQCDDGRVHAGRRPKCRVRAATRSR